MKRTILMDHSAPRRRVVVISEPAEAQVGKPEEEQLVLDLKPARRRVVLNVIKSSRGLSPTDRADVKEALEEVDKQASIQMVSKLHVKQKGYSDWTHVYVKSPHCSGFWEVLGMDDDPKNSKLVWFELGKGWAADPYLRGWFAFMWRGLEKPPAAGYDYPVPGLATTALKLPGTST